MLFICAKNLDEYFSKARSSWFLGFSWSKPESLGKYIMVPIWFFILLPKVQNEGNYYTNKCQMCFKYLAVIKITVFDESFCSYRDNGSRFWSVPSVWWPIVANVNLNHRRNFKLHLNFILDIKTRSPRTTSVCYY